MPMLMANLQTGQMLQAAATLGENSPFISELRDMASGQLATAENALKSVEVRTNLTKVNTTQVFLSTSSVRLNLSIFFLAFSDARTEVEDKIMQLEAWSVPVSLSSESGSEFTDIVKGLHPLTHS
ncbi:hypothetical protein [Klebsiella pneumoniae]